MITATGTVPYPGWVNPQPLYECARNLRALSTAVSDTAENIRATAQQSQNSWSGRAAERFTEHLSERATVVGAVAEVAGQAAPVIETYAAAVELSQDVYSAAAETEIKSRPYWPASELIIDGAMVAQAAAITGLYAAGSVFAGALSALMLKAELADTFAITRNPLEVVGDAVDSVIDAYNNDDLLTGFIRGLNSTLEFEHDDGSVTQLNLTGIGLAATFPELFAILQLGVLDYGLINPTPLTTRDSSAELPSLLSRNFRFDNLDVRTLGNNLAVTEEHQRPALSEPDQSSVIPHSLSISPTGQRVTSLFIPGIVPPGSGSIDGGTGDRNVISAGFSQIAGYGTVELAIDEQIRRLNVKPGDKVVLYGHSYGGIVARNMANALQRRGIQAAFVSYGAPDGPLERGVEAYMVQNPNDFVPAARIAGAGGLGTRYEANQQVIRVHQRSDNGVLGNHDSRFYGENLARTPNLELQDFLRRQNANRIVSSGMFTIEGPTNTAGEPNGNHRQQYPAPLPPPLPSRRR